jgi:hypothetical protein
VNRENVGKAWDQSHLDLLNRMLQEHCSLAHICDKLGRTPAGVTSKALQMGWLVLLNKGSATTYHQVSREPWSTIVEHNALSRM